MKGLQVGTVGHCVICFRTAVRRISRHEDGDRQQESQEMAPKSVVSTSQFLLTFNEIWEVFQNKRDSCQESSGVGEGISLESVMMMEKFPGNVKFTKEAPPTMCQRCCDKIITVDSLMKVVRQQVGEIKKLIMESSMGGCFQGSSSVSDGIQVKDEEIENRGCEILSQGDFQEDVQMSGLAEDLKTYEENSSSVLSLSSSSNPAHNDDEHGGKVTLVDPTGSDLDTHLSSPPSYSIVQLACSVSHCNAIFDNYYNLMEHQKSCQLPESDIMIAEQVTPVSSADADCETTVMTTSTARTAGSSPPPFYKYDKCPKCNKDLTSFAKSATRSRHVKNCGEPPQFKCPFCPLRMARRDNLKVHIKRTH